MKRNLKPAKSVELVKPSKSKVKTIPFNNPLARGYLMKLKIGEHMFTLRSENEKKRVGFGQKKVNNSNIRVDVRYEKLISICRIGNSLWANGQLKPYVEKSGFYLNGNKLTACIDWLNALQKFRYRDIPECKTKARRFFYILKVIRVC